jgi:hypothetical protein
MTALSALVSLRGAATTENRKQHQHECVLALFAILTLFATVYQAWDSHRRDYIRDVLNVDWEKELDSEVISFLIAVLFPAGNTTEGSVPESPSANLRVTPAVIR